MSTFLLVNIGLGIFLGIGSLIVVRMILRNHRRYQFNLEVTEELSRLIKDAKKIAAPKKTMSHDKVFGPDVDLQDPQMLATLVTVLVHKYGNLRLDLSDFAAIKNEDYVSIYVDTLKTELILSLDHTMAEAEVDPVLSNFIKPDDSTYH